MSDTDANAAGAPDSIQVRLVWVDEDAEEILLANHFIVQSDETSFFLTVGQMAPPALLGTPEEKLAQAQAISFLPVKTLGRYALTSKSVDDLIRLLTEVQENYKKSRERR